MTSPTATFGACPAEIGIHVHLWLRRRARRLISAAGTAALNRQDGAASDLNVHFSEADVVHLASSRPVPDWEMHRPT